MAKTIGRYASLTLAGACLLLAAKVTTDYDHKVDFGRYHTYSWKRVRASDQLWQERITRDVDQQLAAKGWRRVPDGGDVALMAFGSRSNQQSLNTFYDDLGGGWFWGGFGDGMATTTVTDTPIGTLVVDMFDPQTKHLLWRGRASDALSDKPEKNTKKLENAVKDLFEHFPPKSNG